jgi:hypothetical protein
MPVFALLGRGLLQVVESDSAHGELRLSVRERKLFGDKSRTFVCARLSRLIRDCCRYTRKGTKLKRMFD